MAAYPQFERIRNKKSDGWLAFLFVSLGLSFQKPLKSYESEFMFGQTQYFKWTYIFDFPLRVTGYSSHKPICIKSLSNLHCFYMYDFAASEATKPNTKQTGIFLFFPKAVLHWLVHETEGY